VIKWERKARSIKGRIQVFEKTQAKAPASKLQRSVIGNSLKRKKTVKLKLSGWYENAAQSIGISKKEPLEKRHGAIE
jgi:hypothetical protein